MKNVSPLSGHHDCHRPYSQQGLAADLASQCMLGVPSYDRPLVQGDTNDLPVTINADHAKGDYPDDAVFTGSVDIMQGNSRLQADEVQLHQKRHRDNRSRYVPLMRSVMSITTITGDPQRAERLGESEHQRYQRLGR